MRPSFSTSNPLHQVTHVYRHIEHICGRDVSAFVTRIFFNFPTHVSKTQRRLPDLQRVTGDEFPYSNLSNIIANIHYQCPKHFMCCNCCFSSQSLSRFWVKNGHFHLPTLLTYINLEHELMRHMPTLYPKHAA